MSDTPIYTPTTSAPVVTDTGADTVSLPPDFRYPTRRVASGSAALAGTPGYDPSQFGAMGSGPGAKSRTESTYSGPKLVNSSGVIEREPYSMREAKGLLSTMGPGERIAFTDELFQRGVYDGKKPSSGRLEARDVDAMQNYLWKMNTYGTTFDRYSFSSQFRQEFPVGGSRYGSGGGRARQVTNADDLRAVFKKSAGDLLGHSLSKDDETRFAKLYQQMERGGDAPDANVVASNQIEKRFGAESQAYRAGGLADIMDQMIAGWSN